MKKTKTRVQTKMCELHDQFLSTIEAGVSGQDLEDMYIAVEVLKKHLQLVIEQFDKDVQDMFARRIAEKLKEVDSSFAKDVSVMKFDSVEEKNQFVNKLNSVNPTSDTRH